MSESKTKGVLLVAFGGPDTHEAIVPFMSNLLGGRPLPPPLVTKVKERYNLIGGASPLPGVTKAQAEALENKLNSKAPGYKVYMALRYWHPSIEEAITAMVNDGIEEAVIVSLSPHYSRVTIGAYREEVERVVKTMEEKAPVITYAGEWFDHPLFIEALADNFFETLASFPEEKRQSVQVIFSAHSLPVEHIKSGDSYVEELNATVKALAEKIGPFEWHLGYQSKGGGQGEWLGPEAEEILDKLAEAGHKDILLVPVGFAADHIETLYDIDIAIKGHAQSLGLNFERSRALNTSDKFLAALADIVLKAN